MNKDPNSVIIASWMAIALNFITILGMLCLMFLDMTPVLRIIWMVMIFGYLGFLLIGSIIKLVILLKTYHKNKEVTNNGKSN